MLASEESVGFQRCGGKEKSMTGREISLRVEAGEERHKAGGACHNIRQHLIRLTDWYRRVA